MFCFLCLRPGEKNNKTPKLTPTSQQKTPNLTTFCLSAAEPGLGWHCPLLVPWVSLFHAWGVWAQLCQGIPNFDFFFSPFFSLPVFSVSQAWGKKTPKPQNQNPQMNTNTFPCRDRCGHSCAPKSAPISAPRTKGREAGVKDAQAGLSSCVFLLPWVLLCVSPGSPGSLPCCCWPGVFAQGVLECGSAFSCFLDPPVRNSPGAAPGPSLGQGQGVWWHWDLALVPTGSCSGLQPLCDLAGAVAAHPPWMSCCLSQPCCK